MAHDDCHSSRLLKKREERNEKPQESESYSISSCVSYSIGTVTRSSTCTRILKRYVFVPEIENSTEICKDKKMKTNTILFRKAFLSFSSFFSLFFFFFFFPFRNNKLWHLRAEEKFLNLVLIIPCLFRYAGSHVYLSPPVPGYMMYFLAWVSLYLIFFYFFLVQQ